METGSQTGNRKGYIREVSELATTYSGSVHHLGLAASSATFLNKERYLVDRNTCDKTERELVLHGYGLFETPAIFVKEEVSKWMERFMA